MGVEIWEDNLNYLARFEGHCKVISESFTDDCFSVNKCVSDQLFPYLTEKLSKVKQISLLGRLKCIVFTRQTRPSRTSDESFWPIAPREAELGAGGFGGSNEEL